MLDAYIIDRIRREQEQARRRDGHQGVAEVEGDRLDARKPGRRRHGATLDGQIDLNGQ